MENVCSPEKRNRCPLPRLCFLLAVKRAGGRRGSRLSSRLGSMRQGAGAVRVLESEKQTSLVIASLRNCIYFTDT